MDSAMAGWSLVIGEDRELLAALQDSDGAGSVQGGRDARRTDQRRPARKCPVPDDPGHL